MGKNNKCCIGILKWQFFWEKEKMLKRLLLWDGGSTALEPVSKSIFIILSSLAHCIANKRHMASPISTSIIGVIHSVFAITKFPFASRIQAPRTTLTLHLNLPTIGLVHFTISLCTVLEGPQFRTSYMLPTTKKSFSSVTNLLHRFHNTIPHLVISMFPYCSIKWPQIFVFEEYLAVEV